MAVAIRDHDTSVGDPNLLPYEAGMPLMMTSEYSDQQIAEVFFVSEASLTWMRA